MSQDPNPVIRHQRYRGTSNYEVTWQDGGETKEKNFETQADAEAFAQSLRAGAQAAAEPAVAAAAGPEPVALTEVEIAFATAKVQAVGKDLRTILTEYLYANKLLEPTGTPLLDAVREYVDARMELKVVEAPLSTAIFEYVEARRQLEGAPLGEAVRQYKKAAKLAGFGTEGEAGKAKPGAGAGAAPAAMVKPTITVPKLVELYLASRAKAGADEEEVAEMGLRLNRFALAFPIVATGDLFFANDAWFAQLAISEASRQKLKLLVVEMGQYAVESGFRL
jgi:hypothetical protein